MFGEHHGGSGGSLSKFSLNPRASILIVQGRAGDIIDSLEFISTDGLVYGPYGGLVLT